MASAGDGERPRLPDTDDPFVLLGIERDADTRTVRRAYAQLIRIYRPDRAPREFQRIHAAFEEVQRSESLWLALGKLRAEAPAAVDANGAAAEARSGGSEAPAVDASGVAAEARSGEASAGASSSAEPPVGASPGGGAEPGEADRARAAEVARRLDEARELAERGDSAAAAAAVNALLDERTPLDLLAGHPEHATLLARHPSLSWTRLHAVSSDPGAIRAIWNLAWRTAYEHDLGRARALLDDDRLRLDGADDPQLAGICLLRIGGLAWKGVDVAKLLGAYRAAIPAHPMLDDLLASIELDIAAAASLRHTPPHAARWVGQMRALLAAGRIGDPDSRRAAARAVMATLERDLDATLCDLDALHDELDLGPLFEAIYTQLPPGATRLDALDKDVFDRVTLALHELGHTPHKWKAIGGVLGVTALAGATGGLGLGFAVIAGAVGAFVGTEKRRYRRDIRPGLARVLLQTPVTTWVLSRWVRLNGRLAGRLWRFDLAIDNDRALYALSMLASSAISIGELDDP
jgi:hypothetical protein